MSPPVEVSWECLVKTEEVADIILFTKSANLLRYNVSTKVDFLDALPSAVLQYSKVSTMFIDPSKIHIRFPLLK